MAETEKGYMPNSASDTLNFLVEAIQQFGFVEKIYLFGSRARGDHQERSDIDIAVDCAGATNDDWNLIIDLVDKAPTLFKIDCVRFDSLSDTNKLKEAILRDGIVLYQRKF